MFIDQNGVSCFVDQNGITSFVDQNGVLLTCGAVADVICTLLGQICI